MAVAMPCPHPTPPLTRSSTERLNVPLDGADGAALHLAATSASADVVRELLERGAHVNAINMAGETALHMAARRGDLAVVEAILVEAGVQVDALDGHRFSPLMLAAFHQQWDSVRLLRHAGASPAPPNAAPSSSSNDLAAVEAALRVCTSLWPRPTVRYCAIGVIGRDAPLASYVSSSAPSGWSDTLACAHAGDANPAPLWGPISAGPAPWWPRWRAASVSSGVPVCPCSLVAPLRSSEIIRGLPSSLNLKPHPHLTLTSPSPSQLRRDDPGC